MKKIFVIFAIVLMGCTGGQVESRPIQTATPLPTADLSAIKENSLEKVGVIEDFLIDTEGYGLFRTYDKGAGVVCWFIYNTRMADDYSLGLGCLPINNNGAHWRISAMDYAFLPEKTAPFQVSFRNFGHRAYESPALPLSYLAMISARNVTIRPLICQYSGRGGG